MKFVALLRGINVGGNNKVDMKALKSAFTDAGMTSVSTYINSGNVIFSSRMRNQERLAARLEAAIAQAFGFDIRVLVRSHDNLREVLAALPDDWVTDTEMRCDVLFLWQEVDSPAVLDDVTPKAGIDDVRYAPGALIWRVDRDKVTRSGLSKMVGSPLYKQTTIRNSNTARKLLALMDAAE
jgi:uncharacterized protein (DUF1697 family)